MGKKWKTFFTSLEAANLLDPNLDDHIWLLHFLFLPCINQDLQEWAEVWNSHKIRLGDQGKESSPKELFVMGRLEAGFTLDNNHTILPETDVDAVTYGVDWEELDNDELLRHHDEHNNEILEIPQERQPFMPNCPEKFASVQVPTFDCPFNEQTLHEFCELTSGLPQLQSHRMSDRRDLWISALAIARTVSHT